MFRLIFHTKKSDGTPLVKHTDKEFLWKGFFSLVKISINFIHEKRKVIKYDTQSHLFLYENPDEYPHVINLEKLIDKWNIKNIKK